MLALTGCSIVSVSPVPSVAVLQRCSAQLLITGDSLQYADQREIWDICGAVASVATPTDILIGLSRAEITNITTS